MKLKTIAIDDEQLSLDTLEDYCNKIEFLNFVAKFKDPLEASAYLKKEKVDLIFLDVQMPNLDGIELLKSLPKQQNVIFVTAYEDYALTSYEYNAIDYIMKPLPFSRFMLACNKAYDLISKQKGIVSNPYEEFQSDFIFITTGGKTLKVNLHDINMIVAHNDFCVFYTNSENYVVHESMKYIEEVLEPIGFVRIHKSYIVPVSKIESIDGNVLKAAGEEFPIGRTFRDNLLKTIEPLKIG